ncbi:uncharacterized protein LOC120108653, partial [Phoenix dactylifera]|uniref:Uncharacterized protein LOC120108653 n=1 Tax=Phoenix dactylifera TaxID=42345 RepID=A0A8B9A4K9_PHODC
MLVKSRMAKDHVVDLDEAFSTLRKYRMKLNPAKCAFGVTSGKFLGFVITQRGIEANPKKIRALQEMVPSRTVKEVQRLTGRVAALGRFVSRSAERCLPFFAALKRPKDFLWPAECQQAFEELKHLLASPPLLTKPQQGELLYLYLAVFPVAVSSILVREENRLQRPVYYTSWIVLEELRSGPFELGEFDLKYRPRPAIKAQALADFIVECTVPDKAELELASTEQTLRSTWTLHVDGSSNSVGGGAGLILTSPDGVVAEQALRLKFSTSNNVAEYETLITGLKLARELEVKDLRVFSDSQLVVNQILGDFEAREPTMQEYLRKVRDLTSTLCSFHIQHIARSENLIADQLSKLASSRMSELPKAAALEYLQMPSTKEPEPALCIDVEPSWMDELVIYLQDDVLPIDEREARRVKCLASRYIMYEGKLYRRSFTSPLLRCLRPSEADYAMREVHEEICGNHLGGRALAHKILRQGYYWPTLQKDTLDFVRRCDRCQRNANIQRRPSAPLTSISSSWPFAQWRIDILGPFPLATGQRKFLVVYIDYFTKWVEAEPAVRITEQKMQDFIWKSIICRFGLPYILISDNGRQFDNARFREFCSELGIDHRFTSVAHPQTNGETEVTNRTILQGLKARLDQSK